MKKENMKKYNKIEWKQLPWWMKVVVIYGMIASTLWVIGFVYGFLIGLFSVI